MFKALLDAGQSLRASVRSPTVFELRDNLSLSDEELFDFSSQQDKRLKAALLSNEELHRFSIIAANVAMSYLLGIGTSVRELFAIGWLCVAAGAGEGRSVHLFSPLEQSVDNHPEISLPRRLWSVLGVLAGYRHNAECIRDTDPSLADIATRMYRRRVWGRTQPQIVRIEPYLPNLIDRIRDDPSRVDAEAPSRRGYTNINEAALHVCAATGDLESTRYLVADVGANINATNSRNETPIFYATRAGQFEVAKFLYDHDAEVSGISTEGFAITHFLSMLDDEHGAELLPLYVSRGARLDVTAQEPQALYADQFCRGMGLPLFWAALKGRPLLFARLLDMHARPEHRILSRADVSQLLGILAKLHLHAMLETALRRVASTVDPVRSLPHDSDIDPGILRRLQSLSLEHHGEAEPHAPAIMSALLYEALDIWPPTVLHRRYILRDKFRSDKEKTISLLLAKGADPFTPTAGLDSESGEVEEGIPMTVAVYTGDIISFRLFLQHARGRGIDTLPILAEKQRYGGYSALQRSIYSDARELFFLLLNEFPSLLDEVGEHGRRPLHSAATQEWPGYVQELLRRGASPYDRSRDRSTPFSWALMRNRNIKVAELLADSCDDMGPVLGPDEQSGFTCFGKVLSGMIAHRMDYGLERLRYLVDKFGRPDFFCCVNPNGWHNTVFKTVLLQKTSPTDRAQIALEMSTLEFLLELFPDKLDFIDFSGRAPLHYATVYGNHAAVEVLLRHGADPKLETTPAHASLDPSQSRGAIGYTALDLAARYQRNGPGAEVLRGGQRDIREWESNMQKIIRDLIAAGDGESGSGVSLQDGLLTSMAAGRLHNAHLGSSKSTLPPFLSSRHLSHLLTCLVRYRQSPPFRPERRRRLARDATP